jgi:hypothetical protein
MISPEKVCFAYSTTAVDQWPVSLPLPDATQRGSVVRGERAVIVVKASGNGNHPRSSGSALLRFRNSNFVKRMRIPPVKQCSQNSIDRCRPPSKRHARFA